jgi:hypothetical protein
MDNKRLRKRLRALISSALWIMTYKVQANEMGCDGMLKAGNLLRFQG